MRSLVLLLLLLGGQSAFAADDFVVAPESVRDVIEIEDPAQEWTYYGELKGFQHTYEFTITEPIELYFQIREPKTAETAQANFSGLVVRGRDSGRGVEAVVRLPARSVPWDEYTDTSEAVSYFIGPEYREEIKPGFYRLEVSTPVNQGKYALTIGTVEPPGADGYWFTLSRTYAIKRFLGQPPLAMITVPQVYIPLGLSLLASALWYWWRRRSTENS